MFPSSSIQPWLHHHTIIIIAYLYSHIKHFKLCQLQGQTNSLRLRGGLIPEQGNVELCINGGWTGVCDTSWDYKDAFVVCRQLGLPATGNNIIHISTKHP